MLEFLKNIPDYAYYIIGAVVAILIMLVIILSAKKSNKKEDKCNHENCDCHNHSANQSKTETSEEVAETKTEELVEEVKADEVAEESKEEKKVVEEEPKAEETETKPELSKKEKLNRYRVTYDKVNQNWVVKMDGATRASKRCATKEEALKVAKELAKKKDSKLSVHKKDGKFQKKANVK